MRVVAKRAKTEEKYMLEEGCAKYARKGGVRWRHEAR